MLNRVLDVLNDKHTTWFYVELPKIDMEALRKKIIAILKDKHGGIGTEYPAPNRASPPHKLCSGEKCGKLLLHATA